jgi:hypothetical protein
MTNQSIRMLKYVVLPLVMTDCKDEGDSPYIFETGTLKGETGCVIFTRSDRCPVVDLLIFMAVSVKYGEREIKIFILKNLLEK